MGLGDFLGGSGGGNSMGLPTGPSGESGDDAKANESEQLNLGQGVGNARAGARFLVPTAGASS